MNLKFKTLLATLFVAVSTLSVSAQDQTKAALINTDKSDDADKAGYLSFGFENYGEHCSLLTIPSSELEKGEYGVYFLGNMFGPNLAILCYTFSVQ